MLVSACLYALIKGRLPLYAWSFQAGSANKVLFGDKSVNPYLLKGFRARWVSLALVIFALIFLYVVMPQNNSIINVQITNMISVITGIILGIVGYRRSLKLVEDKFW